MQQILIKVEPNPSWYLSLAQLSPSLFCIFFMSELRHVWLTQKCRDLVYAIQYPHLPTLKVRYCPESLLKDGNCKTIILPSSNLIERILYQLHRQQRHTEDKQTKRAGNKDCKESKFDELRQTRNNKTEIYETKFS